MRQADERYDSRLAARLAVVVLQSGPGAKRPDRFFLSTDQLQLNGIVTGGCGKKKNGNACAAEPRRQVISPVLTHHP